MASFNKEIAMAAILFFNVLKNIPRFSGDESNNKCSYNIPLNIKQCYIRCQINVLLFPGPYPTTIHGFLSRLGTAILAEYTQRKFPWTDRPSKPISMESFFVPLLISMMRREKKEAATASHKTR